MNILKQTLGYIVVFLILTISTKYEFDAYTHVLAQMTTSNIEYLWPAVVAIAFNIGKFLLFQSIIESPSKSILVLWKSYLALALVMLNSFVCAFFMMSYSLESPNLDSVVTEQRRHITAGQQVKEQAVINKFTRLRDNLEAQLVAETQRNIAQYQPQIDTYDAQLAVESKVVVRGEFRGKNYREIERLLTQEKAKLSAANDASQTRFANHMAVLNTKMENELQALSAAKDEAHDELSVDAIKASGSEGIYDEMLLSGLKVFNGISNRSAVYLHLIGFFALLMALIVETLAYAIMQCIHRWQHIVTDDDSSDTQITTPTSTPYLSHAA